jgi:hypothetical protein
MELCFTEMKKTVEETNLERTSRIWSLTKSEVLSDILVDMSRMQLK